MEKKCTLDQWWNNNKYQCDCKKHIHEQEYTWNLAQIKCQCECKKYYICEKHYLWNPTTYICENEKYLASVNDDSVIRRGEITDAEGKSYDGETKTVLTNFNKKSSL